MTMLILSHIYAVGAGAIYTYLLKDTKHESKWQHQAGCIIAAIIWPLCVITGISVYVIRVTKTIFKEQTK